MEITKVLGLVGSIALILCLFFPLFSIPLAGSYNAMRMAQQMEQYLLIFELIILGILGIVFTVKEDHIRLIIFGSIALGDWLFNIIRSGYMLNKNLGEFRSVVQYEWGWGAWLLGAALLLVSGIMGYKKEQAEKVQAIMSHKPAAPSGGKKYVDRPCPKCSKLIDGIFAKCPYCGFQDNPALRSTRSEDKRAEVYMGEIKPAKNVDGVCSVCGYDGLTSFDKKCAKCHSPLVE